MIVDARVAPAALLVQIIQLFFIIRTNGNTDPVEHTHHQVITEK